MEAGTKGMDGDKTAQSNCLADLEPENGGVVGVKG